MAQQGGNLSFSTDDRIRMTMAVISFLTFSMPATLATRLASIMLFIAGMDPKDVATLTGSCTKTARTVLKRMKSEDISALFEIHGGGSKGKIDQAGIRSAIIQKLETNNYQTRQQVADMIQEDFGLTISITAVGKFLKECGYKILKCGSLPAKADPEAQRTFYDTFLHPLMKEVKANTNKVLLFLDASHFVWGGDFLGSVWCRVRRHVQTSSGRKRYNVLGAIDFVSKKVLTITNETYITATEICDMLELIAKEYAGKEVHIILDNARYQKTAAVMALAKSLGIVLEYIPPYSPNLNLIERLWKFVKAELRTKYYPDFDEFKKRIDEIIASTATTYRSKIDKLIGEKVQMYDNLKPVAPNTYAPAP